MAKKVIRLDSFDVISIERHNSIFLPATYLVLRNKRTDIDSYIKLSDTDTIMLLEILSDQDLIDEKS